MNPLLKETATGRDWQIATLADRRDFCARMQLQRLTEDQLLRALNTLLGGRSGAGRDVLLTEAVTLVLNSWPEEPLEDLRADDAQ